jgi:hypothetical protein
MGKFHFHFNNKILYNKVKIKPNFTKLNRNVEKRLSLFIVEFVKFTDHRKHFIVSNNKIKFNQLNTIKSIFKKRL